MTDYWPQDFTIEDTANPLDILKDAQKEWRERSDGILVLAIQEAESRGGDAMMIVHAKHVPSNRTVSLLSVVHRPGKPYPARIQPNDGDLADFYKKSYYRPGGFAAVAALAGQSGGQVTNKWVCDTPAEFRSKLRDVFNLGVLKSEVLNLLSAQGAAPESDDELHGSAEPSGGAGNEDEQAG